MDFRRLTDEAHRNAVDKGFYRDTEIIDLGIVDDDEFETLIVRLKLARLAMIGSEVSETVEAVRRGAPAEEVQVELADIVIRTMDFAGWLGLDLAGAIEAKMEKNRQRPHMHGKLA